MHFVCSCVEEWCLSPATGSVEDCRCQSLIVHQKLCYDCCSSAVCCYQYLPHRDCLWLCGALMSVTCYWECWRLSLSVIDSSPEAVLRLLLICCVLLPVTFHIETACSCVEHWCLSPATGSVEDCRSLIVHNCCSSALCCYLAPWACLHSCLNNKQFRDSASVLLQMFSTLWLSMLPVSNCERRQVTANLSRL